MLNYTEVDMIKYKSELEKIPWESPMKGVRHKYFDQNGMRLRLVEYSREMPVHWCEKGHLGYLIEGEMEIEFENTSETYLPGDAIFIPDGSKHKHKGRVLTEKAMAFFVENL
jgi:quercetin dioxygenase-like cupin family protein